MKEAASMRLVDQQIRKVAKKHYASVVGPKDTLEISILVQKKIVNKRFIFPSEDFNEAKEQEILEFINTADH